MQPTALLKKCTLDQPILILTPITKTYKTKNQNCRVEAQYLEDEAAADAPEKHAEAWRALRSADGVLVPGGFGGRGVEGKILAAKYAREGRVPYLGICLGMQVR